jgi:hypothetical protein
MKSKKVLNLYPIDYPFETLVSRAQNGKLILNPEFQRKYKWDEKGYERASRFVESCLMRIPLPACYFAENEQKNHLVIDGVQRITTIINFLNDDFALEGLTIFKELNGKKFSQLGEYQNDLESYTIRCIILRNDNEPQLIQDIFARLNQGAVTLSHQEIRHAIFPGTFDELLTKLARIDVIKNFSQGVNSRIIKNSLESEELVLRFFALRGDLADYEDNFTKYLDRYMEAHQNISEKESGELERIFERALENCQIIFGDRVFVGGANAKQRQSFVYYDLLMWSMQNYDKKFVEKNKKKIHDAYVEFCHEPTFKRSLTGMLLVKGSILKRRRMWKEKLNQCLK